MKRTAIKIRIGDADRLRLMKAAKRNGISINQEITNRLQDSFDLPTIRQALAIMHDMSELIGLATLSRNKRAGGLPNRW